MSPVRSRSPAPSIQALTEARYDSGSFRRSKALPHNLSIIHVFMDLRVPRHKLLDIVFSRHYYSVCKTLMEVPMLSFMKVPPTTYVLQYKHGKIKREGAGLSFF